MSSVLPKRLTVEEFERASDLASRHELVRGELVPTMPSNLLHACIAARIAQKLGNFCETGRLGTIFSNDPGFRLTKDTLRGPDVAFLAAGRLPGNLKAEFGELAPDLVTEIVSPSDTAYEIEDKVQTYLESGVRLVWIVYPHRKTVHVFRGGEQSLVLCEAATLSGEDVLPGFELPLRELFQDAA